MYARPNSCAIIAYVARISFLNQIIQRSLWYIYDSNSKFDGALRITRIDTQKHEQKDAQAGIVANHKYA